MWGGGIQYRETSKPANSIDRESRNQSLDRLADLRVRNKAKRLRAIKSLAKVANRFPDLTPKEAKIVAKYLFHELDDEEFLQAEQATTAFRHWPNLILAMVDQLEKSKTPIDRVVSLFRVILNNEINLSGEDVWKVELKRSVMSQVVVKMNNSVESTSNSKTALWNRLRYYLKIQNELRAKIIAGKLVDSLSESENIVGNQLAAWQRVIALGIAHDQKYSFTQKLSLKREMDLIPLLSSNSLQQTVMFNRLIMSLLATSMKKLHNDRVVDGIVSNELNNASRDLLTFQLLSTESQLRELLELEMVDDE